MYEKKSCMSNLPFYDISTRIHCLIISPRLCPRSPPPFAHPSDAFSTAGIFVLAIKVEWFCFPQGLFLQSAVSRPTPHMSSFVRFTSGVRSYGICLTFYREVSVSSRPAESRVSSFFARGAVGIASSVGWLCDARFTARLFFLKFVPFI